MSDEHITSEQNIFDATAWAELPAIFDRLPTIVQLNVWADAAASSAERQAVTLCATLAGHFETIQTRSLPRQANYPFYPVIGIMGQDDGGELDLGVRLIGLPDGYQMTSLIAAIQAVSFRGTTLEPRTRIGLHKLSKDATIELMTSAENEGGPIMARIVFGMAAASRHVKSYLIMSDEFPDANRRYSIKIVPHIVINSRVHIEGIVDELTMMKHLRAAVNAG